MVSLGRMASSPPRTVEEWRAWYRAAADALERVRLQELAALSDQDALKRTLSLTLFEPMPNASTAPSVVTDPPTSRKFAGSAPCSLMISMVAIARPAPFTRQPIAPSSAM